MFNWFKKKEEESYSIKITRTSKDVLASDELESKFLNNALTCPDCGHRNKQSFIRSEGNGKKYSVPMKCSNCRCEWIFERPYKF